MFQVGIEARIFVLKIESHRMLQVIQRYCGRKLADQQPKEK